MERPDDHGAHSPPLIFGGEHPGVGAVCSRCTSKDGGGDDDNDQQASTIEAGDLVLLRDLQPEKQHGKKLNPRWFVRRIVDSLSSSGVSCNVRQIHDPPTATKRYHIDDLAVYAPPNHSQLMTGAGGAARTRG